MTPDPSATIREIANTIRGAFPEAAARLDVEAVHVRRMERTLDEIAEDAQEDARIAEAQRPAPAWRMIERAGNVVEIRRR